VTQKTLEILDNSAKYSLWTFLIVLALTLALVFAWRRRQAGQWSIRSALRAAILSLAAGVLAFLITAFTPIAPFENFASVRQLDETPLRLTSLIYERSYEGFTVQGEVWNQSHALMTDLQARIQIWGNDGKALDQVTTPVLPRELAPGQSGAFTVEYLKNSPFLYGYEVAFLSADGKVIPHVKGFDVH
jgi:hypothetical protein